MNIVVTDGYTVNPGDLDWKSIGDVETVTIYDRTPYDMIIDRCKKANIILTNKVPFDKETIAALPQLQLISVLATGYNVIDITAATERGITVCNVPAYGTDSVAQHTFALLLELTNGVGKHAHAVQQGEWQRAADWCFARSHIVELRGKVMGIVGFGNIGQQTAAIAAAFGMKVIYYSTTKKETAVATFCDLKTLFAESDVVSIHCPLTPNNFQFVNADLLQLMKRNAFLINTSRGNLIEENDLAIALNKGTIAGAALDVLSTEPPKGDNPLLSATNCIITPHNAWMSREARRRVLDITAQNIAAFLQGQPINVVNG